MNEQYIAEHLVAIHTALVAKTGEQPLIEPALTIHQKGECSIGLHGAYRSGGGDYTLGYARGKTIRKALDAAYAFIAALPDPDEAAKRKFQKNLGAVIDEGNGLNMPTEVMAPLSQGMQALSENLLAHEAAE